MPAYPVARAAEVSEQRGRVVVAGERAVAIFRRGDRVFALDNACVHNGGPLGEGEVDDGYVVCPWHGWRYDLETGTSPLNPAVRVATFVTWVADGTVWVEVP